MKKKVQTHFGDYLPYALWVVATGALIGSLVLSEVMDLIPCTLCWWQRVFMFSAAFVATVGVLLKDKNIGYYILSLAVPGAVIAFYHSLLQWGIIKESVLDCSLTGAVSCANAEINYLGFITIPFMALVCFVALIILSWFSLPSKR
jgi:disulfide bond formation protein DsbB